MLDYQNQLTQMLAQSLNQPTLLQQKVVEVSGRPGAEAYKLGPDSSALLLDNTDSVVWLVKTDGAGYKTVKGFNIVEKEEQKPEDAYKLLEERITKLEERLNESNTTNAKQRKSAE